jgi:hypothetical protein
VVALPEIDVEPQRRSRLAAVFADLLERLAAIDAGFTLAQHVQVRAVEDKDRFRHAEASVRPFIGPALL